MIEGKTKILKPLWSGSSIAVVTTKDDITAGDGKKHDILLGKAELATRTTCNVFEYLRWHSVPLAYVGRDGERTFLTRICTMIPVEIVVRRIATGSYIKRYPHVNEGTVFANPILEFFYKTTGRRIGSQTLPCDDPLMMRRHNGTYDLYLPNASGNDAYIGPLNISEEELSALRDQLWMAGFIAERVMFVLENAWKVMGGTLYDFKIECGVLPDGSVVVADVIDCDSWRGVWEGIQLSKQGYRDGDDLERVLGVYRLAASLTDRLV